MTDRTDWPHDEPDGWTDLGGEHLIRAVVEDVDGSTRPAGWLEYHRDPTGEWCGGFLSRLGSRIQVEDGRPAWMVVLEEPLTLTPSVLCTTCGSHGWVVEGRWVPA